MKKNTQRTKPNDPGFESPWSDEAIREQLNRILEHPEFQATDKMRDFLRYVVEETLAGNSKRIKGFSIAIEVLGETPILTLRTTRSCASRPVAYAGRSSVITWSGACRIQSTLIFQKAVTSRSLPKAPVQNHHQTVENVNRGKLHWLNHVPVVMIMPFKDLTGKPEYAYLGLGLATELSMELGNCADLRIVQYREGSLVEEQTRALNPTSP